MLDKSSNAIWLIQNQTCSFQKLPTICHPTPNIMQQSSSTLQVTKLTGFTQHYRDTRALSSPVYMMHSYFLHDLVLGHYLSLAEIAVHPNCSPYKRIWLGKPPIANANHSLSSSPSCLIFTCSFYTSPIHQLIYSLPTSPLRQLFSLQHLNLLSYLRFRLPFCSVV